MPVLCKVADCGTDATAKGFCKIHYLRHRRHGGTEAARGGTLAERFQRGYFRGAPDACWEWQGQRAKYGLVRRPEGGSTGAHRVSYEVHHGPIPPGLVIMHSCDNPLCVNPAHLRAGTYKENTADMDAKGRRVIAYAKGEKSQLSVLNEHAVRFIRSSDLTTADLARIFGLTHQAIRAVRIRKSWKHVA